MKIKKQSIIGFLVAILYCFLVLNKILNYQMLPQVTAILDGISGSERFAVIEEMFYNLHPHALRAGLMLPVYMLSNVLDIDLNVIFGFFVVLNIYFSYRMVAYMGIRSSISNIVVLCFFFVLLLLMNGRIAFAIFGNTLILYTLFRRYYIGKGSLLIFLSLIVLGLLFCSV
ncbi:MAG: hypothetical protein ACWIPH_06600, partial [Ostreibacterium sp.]